MSEKLTLSELKAEMSQLRQENIDDRLQPPSSVPVQIYDGTEGFSYFEMPGHDSVETADGTEVKDELVNDIGSLPVHNHVTIDATFEENAPKSLSGNEYDNLWVVKKPHERVRQLEIVELTEKQKRIFAPPIDTSKKNKHEGKSAEQLADEILSVGENEYDMLWDANYKGSSTTEEAAIRPSKTRGVTESSLTYAKSMYQGRMDPDIEAIIEDSVGVDATVDEKIEQMRTNEVMRDTLAGYILGKINRNINLLPYNIQRNANKGHNHVGYEDNMSSHDYVAVLVLSYLDGTFDPDQVSKDDGIVYREDGSIERGQHRYAAMEMLFN